MSAESAAVRVGDIVAVPGFKLEVLAGSGGLDRTVSFTHVSELEEPAAWLDGGELLMTNGLGIPADPAAQVQYLTALRDRRAAGLAIGVRGPVLTGALVAAADDWAFPILRVPREIPFLSIAHYVTDGNHNAVQRRLLAQVRIYDTLRLRASGESGIGDLFGELERISGYRLDVVSPEGQSLFAELSRHPRVELPTQPPSGSHFPLPGGFGIAIPVNGRLAGYLLALEREDTENQGLAALQHIATIAALELAALYRDREVQRRIGAELFAQLLSGALPAKAADAALRRHNLPPGDRLSLVAFRGLRREIDDEALHHLLCNADVPHLMLGQERPLALLAAQPDVLPEIAVRLDAIAGVSTALTDIAAIRLARREAVFALAVGASKDTRIAQFADRDTFMQWLPRSLADLEALVASRLGPIEEYDAAHGTQLLRSLSTYFTCGRRISAAADELFVHKHTLKYRLDRIEALTGRNLNSVEDTSEFWLALRARPLVREMAEEYDS